MANFVRDFKAAHLDLQHEATSELAGFQAHFAEQAHLTEEFRNVNLVNQTDMNNFDHANLATTKKFTNLLSTITSLQYQVHTLSNRRPRSYHSKDNNHNTGRRGTGGLQRSVNVDLKCAYGTRAN